MKYHLFFYLYKFYKLDLCHKICIQWIDKFHYKKLCKHKILYYISGYIKNNRNDWINIK